MIKQDGSDWVLYSKDGSKELYRDPDKEKVVSREKEIEYFSSKAEIDIVVKATLGDDGTMRWKSSVSTTALDKQNERTTVELYKSWIEAIENGTRQTWLPPARNPFLGVAHYPSLEGKGEAGPASVVYVDGRCCKAKGTFNETPLGKAMFDALRQEQTLAQKGETIESPIRISAGWYDEAHSHEGEEFIFERKSLTDKCPLCEKGIGGKVYLKGQLDHFAATRVPVNPETNLHIEEKSMPIATRKSDAESIIGTDLAEILETEVKITSKSDALIVKALTKTIGEEEFEVGDFLVVEDAKKVTTWHLPVKRQGKIDHNLMGAAKAALTVGSRGNVYEGPNKQEALDKLKKLYESEEMTWKADLPKKEVIMKKENITYKGVTYMWDEESEDYMDEDGNSAPEAAKMPPTKKMMPDKKAKALKSAIVSYAEAKSLAEDNSDDIGPVSAWDIFKSTVETVFEQEDEASKVDAIKSLVDEFDQDIETIKSQVADAYLGYMEQTVAQPEVEKAEYDPNDITLQLKAAVDATLDDSTLSIKDKEQILQKSLGDYVQQLKLKLNPKDVQKSDQVDIESIVDSKLNPVIEKLNLIAEQMTAKAEVQVAAPVQKSAVPSADLVNNTTMPVSSVTGKPSSLTAIIQRSVGL